MDIIQEQPAIDILPTDQGGTSKDFTPAPDTEGDSLAGHIEDFHAQPEAKDDAAKPDGQKPRHRAKSQQASPADVPRIKELTAKLREAERRAEDAERRAAPRTDAERRTPPVEATTPAPASKVATVPEKFTFESIDAWAAKHPEVEPGELFDAWSDAKLDARDAWKDGRAKVVASVEQEQQAERDTEAAITAKATKYRDDLDAYTTANPDRKAAFQNIPTVPPLMLETIWGMDNAPDVVYRLRQSPGLFQEMALLTEGKPLSPQHVALATDWLQTRLQAGTTGAAVRVPSSPPAPHPPTPVRTMPQPPPSAPPGDSASLLEHNRFYKTAQ